MLIFQSLAHVLLYGNFLILKGPRGHHFFWCKQCAYMRGFTLVLHNCILNVMLILSLPAQLPGNWSCDTLDTVRYWKSQHSLKQENLWSKKVAKPMVAGGKWFKCALLTCLHTYWSLYLWILYLPKYLLLLCIFALNMSCLLRELSVQNYPRIMWIDCWQSHLPKWSCANRSYSDITPGYYKYTSCLHRWNKLE